MLAALLIALSAPASAADGLAPGQAFVVRDLGTADAYYFSRNTLIGVTCTATAPMRTVAGGFFAGDAKCNGTDYEFSQALIEPATGGLGSAVSSDSGTTALDAVPSGTTFVVADIGPEDAYFGTKGDVIGKSCVATAEFTRIGSWWSGPASCDGT